MIAVWTTLMIIGGYCVIYSPKISGETKHLPLYLALIAILILWIINLILI